MANNPIHLMERQERMASELQQLDAGLAPKVVLNKFIDALPSEYDVLKQQFGGQDVEKSTVLTSMMARYSELMASSRKGDAEVLLAKDSKGRDSGGGVRCFVCDRRGHVAKNSRSKKEREEVGGHNLPHRRQIA